MAYPTYNSWDQPPSTVPRTVVLFLITNNTHDSNHYYQIYRHRHYLVGGFNHLEKYESYWEGLSHILLKIKNV